MRVIHNRWLPLPGFTAINLFGVVFARRGVRLDRVLLNHELIHTCQQRELLYVGFYVWYVLEWLWHLARLRDAHRAYRAISMEREAYLHQRDLTYIARRRRFAWSALLRC